MADTYLLAIRCPVYRRRESHLGFRTELENLAGDPIKGDVKSKFFSLPSWEKWMLSWQPAPLQPAPIFLLEEGFWF